MAEFLKKTVKKKLPKPMTEKRLSNIALYYLQRFASSKENLREVLLRRAKKSTRDPEDLKQIDGWIDTLIQKLEGQGFLNDQLYAEMKVRSFLSRGKSVHYARQKLQQKGIEDPLFDMAVET